MRVKQAEKRRVNKACGGSEADLDQESVGSSSEEMESPRSVLVPKTKIERNNMHRWSSSTTGKNIGVGLYLHNQILRIREEDSYIGEDINAEVLQNLCVGNKQEVASLMLFSKPGLPASPLSGKTTDIKAVD